MTIPAEDDAGVARAAPGRAGVPDPSRTTAARTCATPHARAASRGSGTRRRSSAVACLGRSSRRRLARCGAHDPPSAAPAWPPSGTTRCGRPQRASTTIRRRRGCSTSARHLDQRQAACPPAAPGRRAPGKQRRDVAVGHSSGARRTTRRARRARRCSARCGRARRSAVRPVSTDARCSRCSPAGAARGIGDTQSLGRADPATRRVPASAFCATDAGFSARARAGRRRRSTPAREPRRTPSAACSAAARLSCRPCATG